MRSKMPTVAKWIDEMREAFGRAEIDQANWGAQADGTFGATENGHTIGSHAATERKAA